MIVEALRYLAKVGSSVSSFTHKDAEFVLVHKGSVDKTDFVRVTSPARVRRHVFHDLRDFAEFLNRHAEPSKTDILFDGTRDAVVADFAPRAEDAAADVVSCELKRHPRLERWLHALHAHDQKTLYRLLATAPDEDFGFVGDDPSKGSLRGLLAGRVQQLRVVRDASYEAELDPRGFYRVRGGTENKAITSDIPTEFEVHIPWYSGLEDFSYELQILVEVEIDERRGALFTLTAPGKDLVHAEAVDHAIGVLRSELDDGFLVGRGNLMAPEVQAS